MPATPRVVKSFTYLGRKCYVVEIDRKRDMSDREFNEIRKMSSMTRETFEPYHNGYVQLHDWEIPLGGEYDCYGCSEEITYKNKLDHIDKEDGSIYVGFDTAHYWNHENPDSKKAHAVEKACREMCRDLDKYCGRTLLHHKLKKVYKWIKAKLKSIQSKIYK